MTITIETPRFRVDWEHLGEGYSGEFMENDKTDERLYRFSCHQRFSREIIESGANGGTQWETLPDASYCTHLAITDQIPRILLETTYEILTALAAGGYKRRLEELSWVGHPDFGKLPSYGG